MLQLITLLLLLPTLLWSEPLSLPTENEILESAHNPLTTIYGAPETNILGVNVINGDYNYSCVDFCLPGVDPLILQRSYCSSRNQMRAFYLGWTHNLSGHAITYPSNSDGKEFLHVVTSGSLSGELPFRTETKNSTEELKLNRDVLKKGITNCGRREISGRTNIKNLGVSYSGLGVQVKNGDGTEHRYRRVTERYHPNRPEHPNPAMNPIRYDYSHTLQETIKANGLKTTYDANEHLLLEVKTLTHSEIAANRITFQPPIKIPREDTFSFKGFSRDRKEATYTFKTLKKTKRPFLTPLMSKFESNYLPWESYTYTDPKDGPEKLQERLGSQHLTHIDYYNKGDWVNAHDCGPEEVSKSHIARHRVKRVSVAVKSPEDIRTAYRFAYHKSNYTKEAFTDVYNSNKHLTRFCYSTKDHRLTSIERFKGTSNYTLYRRDRLEFGKKLTPLEGDLLFKTVENTDRTIHYGENLDYDANGNVLKRKQHYRSFKKGKAHSISIEENPLTGNRRLKGGEVKATAYTYNELNLPTSEDDGRLRTVFTYHERNGKETSLLRSKLIQKNNKILSREFYEFDENAGCTLKIEDDGCKALRDDLTGVKSRKIFRYINRQEAFAGLPLEIDQWGSNLKEESRIGRVVLEYGYHGYVEKETHYDSQNIFAYEIQKIRDPQGNIKCETDPEGQTTHRQFNAYGSLLEEHGPNLEYYKEYIYDWLQRPVQEILHCNDGIDLTTIRKYDMEGHLKEIKDPYGFKTTFTYDEQGRLSEIIHPPIRTENGWVRPAEQKDYNFLGHLTSETNAKGSVTLYAPNDAGLPLKISYPDGTSEEFCYSIYGEVLEKRQSNGSKVIYAYDDLSRLKSEEIYDQKGNLLKKSTKKYSGLLLSSETDGEGLKTSYVYDYAGRVSEIHQGKALTKIFYDTLGRIKEERRYFGEREQDYIATQSTYDRLNRVTEKVEVDAKGKIHSKVATTYDADGNVRTTTHWSHASEATTTHQYDARGHLKSTHDPLGNTTVYCQRYDFYFEGHNLPCLEVTDPKGVKTITISDARGLVVCTKTFSPIGKVLAHEEMYYDLQGNLIRKEQHLPNETIVTRWEYDSSSRMIEQVNAVGTDNETVTRYIYNAFGELSETLYADGTSKHRLYDALGRLSEEWSEDHSVHYRYDYNRQDLPILVENCNTGKRTIRKYFLEKNLKSEHFENGLKIAYQYDRLHRMTECIYPDLSSVKQAYNPVCLRKVERLLQRRCDL